MFCLPRRLFDCIATCRLLPVKPYLISDSSPFTSSPTSLLPFPDLKKHASGMMYCKGTTATYANHLEQVFTVILPSPPRLQLDHQPLQGMRMFGLSGYA
jgi:hypothetical protein